MNDALRLNGDLVDRARAAASAIADDIQQHIEEHTTDTTERATLRLLGIAGVNEIDVPLVNVVAEHARDLLPGGIMRPFVDLMNQTGKSAQEVAEGVAAGDLALAEVPADRRAAAEARAEELAREGVARIDAVRARRNELVAQTGEPLKPYVYVIVATGNIYEDAAQAKAAARAGADVIAVIRTTAQSLLDYVPFGETTEGFGGTYATQENFRLMRAALDEVGEELGRYIRLCNYASGLCMPEIATMGALERLDMMLNDSMYGIIFRNINMQRTFVDQYLSRLINARAGIIINTGEDNYLTTADAFEKGYTVVSSDFINEAFALRANLEPWQIGLGHAFEINPQTPDQVVYQIADAQLDPSAVPRLPAQVHAAHQVHAGRHLPGPHHRRHVQLHRHLHRPGDHAARHAHRGAAHAAAPGPLPEHQERQVRVRELPRPGRRGHLQARRHDRAARQRPAAEGHRAARARARHQPVQGARGRRVRRREARPAGRPRLRGRLQGHARLLQPVLRGAARRPDERSSRGSGPRRLSRSHRRGALMLIRPYGDTHDDGIIQFSFTLPMPYSIKAADVGKQFLEKLGFHTVGIAECKAIDPEYTLFVAYGRTDVGIDPDEVKGDYLEVEEMDYYAINALIKEKLGRKLSVVGAAIESDAHTVGIDAIMNMKGFAGNYGLERYPEMDALNMGSQIPCAQLLRTALEREADAILVSQIVTQKNIHVQHLTQLIELLEAEGVRERFVLVVGGPRINNAFAKELGYDAGFGPRTTPLEVASFLAQEVVRRHEEA